MRRQGPSSAWASPRVHNKLQFERVGVFDCERTDSRRPRLGGGTTDTEAPPLESPAENGPQAKTLTESRFFAKLRSPEVTGAKQNPGQGSQDASEVEARRRQGARALKSIGCCRVWRSIVCRTNVSFFSRRGIMSGGGSLCAS
jgi:hypothetical protein